MNEPVKFLEGRLVNAEDDSYYDLPNKSEKTNSLYQHCVRAILRGLIFGKHGLPLIGTGDWNDGMNLVGIQGKGESVWLGFFLYEVIMQFIKIAGAKGDRPLVERLQKETTTLRQNIEQYGWDGEWYRRAYFDDGSPLGSASHGGIHKVRLHGRAICDPYRNRLLFDGAKNDVLDAEKLCLLLKNGLLKEVYHTHSSLFELRKYVGAYEDIIKAGVRIKNQRSSLFRSEGKNFRKESVESDVNGFIVGIIDKNIKAYEKDKEQYKSLFEKLKRKNTTLKNLCKIPGIEIISAVKILSNVIDAHRFPKKGNYLAYCGLVKHKRVSGQKTYGLRNPRYNRVLKSVYKSAALASITANNNPMKDYYEYLLDKGVEVHNARNALARHIATITYGMLKSGEKYQPYKWKKEIELTIN